eukprot:1157308-Pelagomonas_calceolata.AAC.20
MENRGWGPLDRPITGGQDGWLNGWLTTHRIPISLVARYLDKFAHHHWCALQTKPARVTYSPYILPKYLYFP